MNFTAITWEPSLGIELGFFTIRYYSLMFVLAFGVGLALMKRIYIKDGIDLEKLDKLFMYTIIATILGARLGHVFFYDWPYFKNHLGEILLPVKFNPFRFTGFTGLASHGAAVGIIVALYFYSKKILKKPLLYILDRVGIGVALAGFFIRIGNLMNSEIIGKPTGTNFGIIFKNLGEDFPRHPTQLYEAFGYLIIFICLWYLYWKTNKKEQLGYLFGFFFATLWSVRFAVEFLKEAQIDNRGDWDLNTGQLLSIPLVIVGLYFMFRKKK
ncbi:prolipoprotein diacylglyceryl transferase [Flavicella sp.]|uniref:prolipoprotein diacylglyceryl transferase n=1 Tax=Flavicella sp. TaxID=2957742 RepID=UPI00301B0DC5